MRHLRHLRPWFSSSVNHAEDTSCFPVAFRRGKQSAWLSAQHKNNWAEAQTHSITTIFIREDDYLRKRNKTLTIRLTEQEYDTILRKTLRSGMSMTDFLIASTEQTQIHVAEDMKPLVTELKRIGNNLNQITAKINAGIFHSYNFQEVIDLQRAIYEEVRRIGRGD